MHSRRVRASSAPKVRRAAECRGDSPGRAPRPHAVSAAGEAAKGQSSARSARPTSASAASARSRQSLAAGNADIADHALHAEPRILKQHTHLTP